MRRSKRRRFTASSACSRRARRSSHSARSARPTTPRATPDCSAAMSTRLAVKFREITAERTGETSAQIRERVVTARRRQQERFAGKRNVICNARMGTRDLKAFCALDEATLELLKMAINELKLSARAYDRILKVARTIADLAGSERLTRSHRCWRGAKNVTMHNLFSMA